MAPTQKHVVTTVMKNCGSETFTIGKRYQKFQCPNSGCRAILRFLENTGYSNQYRHILSCYAKHKSLEEQERVLSDLFQSVVQNAQSTGNTVLNHFRSVSHSDFEKVIHSHLCLVIFCFLPLNIVSKYSEFVSSKKLMDVMIYLVGLLEIKIGVEMKKTKGAFMYDGWSTNNTHFTAVIASYCTTHKTHDNNIDNEISIPSLSLLAIALMRKVDEDLNASSSNETTRFNAEYYKQFLCDTIDRQISY